MKSSFIDKESQCQYLFDQKGPFWHIATPGNLSEILFTITDDFRFGMSLLAESSVKCGITTYAYQLMNNHLHDIAGTLCKQHCVDLLECVASRLKRYAVSKGRRLDLSSFVCDPLEITSLSGLRNGIVYTHRNGYVVDSRYTPFSYPWGSGSLYFGDDIERYKSLKFSDLTTREQRRILNSRVQRFPDCFTVRNGCISPESFCDWRTGRSFFRDAHQYFNMLTKNFEAYAEFAALLGDSISLTDEEMYSAACSLAKKLFNTNSPGLLSDGAKIELARKLHFDHHAGNNQLRRILKMDSATLDAMFPSAK